MPFGDIYRPIRDENPCYTCKKPVRYPGCHGKCKRHKDWKAKVDKVNQNRREYAMKSDIGWRKK